MSLVSSHSLIFNDDTTRIASISSGQLPSPHGPHPSRSSIVRHVPSLLCISREDCRCVGCPVKGRTELESSPCEGGRLARTVPRTCSRGVNDDRMIFGPVISMKVNIDSELLCYLPADRLVLFISLGMVCSRRFPINTQNLCQFLPEVRDELWISILYNSILVPDQELTC